MNLEEVSQITKIPVSVLRKMRADEIISHEMTDGEWDFLHRLCRVSKRRYFVRHCLFTIRPAKREVFLMTAHLEARWERYAFTHMAKTFAFGKIEMDAVVKQIAMAFPGLEITEEVRKKLKSIRNTIYQKRTRAKKLLAE